MQNCKNKNCKRIISPDDIYCPYCGVPQRRNHNLYIFLAVGIIAISLTFLFSIPNGRIIVPIPTPVYSITVTQITPAKDTRVTQYNPTSTATPLPTKTVTPHPTFTTVLFPEIYDDFNNPAFDGNYNRSLWAQAGDKEASAIQKNGVIQFFDKESKEGGDYVLFLDQPEYRRVSQTQFFEAKLRIDEISGSFSFVKIQISTELNNFNWWTQCRLQTNGQNDASFVCDVYTHSNGNFVQEFQTVEVGTKLNQWYLVRIEIDPKSFELRFSLDGKQIGVYLPKDSRNLLNSMLQPRIGIYTTTGNSVFYSSVDDVKITPK